MSSGDPQASEPASDSPSPETAQPETTPAETPQAEAAQAETAQPGTPPPAEQAAEPVAEQAGESQPGESQPQSSQPESSQPESSQPQSSQPQSSQPQSSQSSSPRTPVARGAGPLAARGLGIAKPSSPAVTAPKQAAKQAANSGAKGKGAKAAGKSDVSAKPASPAAEKPAAEKPAAEKPAAEKPAADKTGCPKPAAAKPASARPSGPALGPLKSQPLKSQPKTKPSGVDKPQRGEAAEEGGEAAPRPSAPSQRVSLPNLRQPLADDLQSLLEAELAAADVDAMLGGSAGMERREQLEEGERVRGKVLKMDEDSVYVALGGPDEGAVSRLQFEEDPEIGSTIETIVRGFNREDGLYNLVLPGQAMDVSDWEDLEEGTIVEAHVAAANTGGLEATVGNIRGFIPISQIAQYRVEDASEFVGQRLMCVVTECNPRRKNLVLSRRAVLEREREEQRKEQLEKMEPGDTLEGTVRSVKDFGAFVDLGGVDGLIHVTKLSWDHIKHPSDVLEVGQKVKVKVEKVDKQTGKIALSYRDLLENPWDSLEATLAVGSVVKGTVSRIANFGAFVRLGAGIEGLVHISELAGHRVSNVSSVLKEGEEVTVKVLSIERDSQRIALSIKQAQSKAAEVGAKSLEEEEEEPPRELAVKRQHQGPLKGGVGKDSGGAQFGLKW
ncbi:30S ribosomal protein S1 [Candidatus Laterigemmans baculatus]|uniref:30S ribosomal protein S1 n=1 Tax=Candidatus Laterigemmans baculatus TaxID=2770505 RepID=UPI00193C21D4|nr:S1 RNA-binding domain-containing protein [Candidatus Laterigemmans baculatus]